MTKLTSAQIIDAELQDWTKLAEALRARFATGNFAAGAAFVAAIADAAEAANHHPDVTLTYPTVEVRLTSHDQGGVTSRDVALARQISAIAAERGIGSDPHRLWLVELGLDTADGDAVGPFWASVLAGDASRVAGDDVIDPTGQSPLLWFQHSDSQAADRQRFHLDVWVHPDTLDDRIAAAVAAGGTVVDRSPYPSFVVLADPDGNKACFCTHLDRDGQD